MAFKEYKRKDLDLNLLLTAAEEILGIKRLSQCNALPLEVKGIYYLTRKDRLHLL